MKERVEGVHAEDLLRLNGVTSGRSLGECISYFAGSIVRLCMGSSRAFSFTLGNLGIMHWQPLGTRLCFTAESP